MPVGARAEDERCTKSAPSRKTAGEEGDRAKAAAATAGAQAGRTLKYPVRPRHGLAEPLAARDRIPRPPRQRQAAVGPLFAPSESPHTAFAASRQQQSGRWDARWDNGTLVGTQTGQ